MRDKTRKKIQHKVNRDVRDLNKTIAEDEKWQGRFSAHQVDSSWWRFEDNSGGLLRVELVYTDTVTHFSHHEYFTCLIEDRFFIDAIFHEMDDFILNCLWRSIDDVKW